MYSNIYTLWLQASEQSVVLETAMTFYNVDLTLAFKRFLKMEEKGLEEWTELLKVTWE